MAHWLAESIMHFVMRVITVVVLLSLTTALARGQELKPDPIRDEVLREHLQGFVTGKATIKELEASLRQFAGQFETEPYKMRWAATERPYVDTAIPEGQLKSIVILIARLTLPTTKSYFSGHLSAPEAAKKLAPFYLIFPGYGIDPPPDADTIWLQRREELLQEIGKYSS